MEGRNRPTRIRGSSPELVQLAREMRANPTPAEALLWAALSGQTCGAVKFRFQHPLGQVILDFYCPAWKLVVELDGGVHRGREEEDAALALAAEHEPGEALARWMQRYAAFIATKRGLASALHSGNPVFDTLPAYF